MITELAKGVYWVGVVDWAIRHFHGYELSTHRGSSYNAYLIVDDKIVLVDSVWQPFQDQLIENIREVVDPAKIDIVVANHAEVDHSGALPAVMRHTPNATVVVSKRGRESVEGHFHQPWNFKPVQTGERLNIGKNELVFVEAPMLHWPDSMFTYLTGHNILMPNDAFGQHYASSYRFNDEVDQAELFEEAQKYYANILTPFSSLVLKKIEEVLALKLPVQMIAPSHGIIWRKEPLQIVKKYQEWAAQVPEKTAVVIFDTMWDATRHMAEAIGEGLADEGIPYQLFHMAVSDRNDVITEIFKAKAVIVGSPTFNQGLLPTITPVLEDLKGLRFQNKAGAAFGSYGWSGESIKQIEEHLLRCKIPVVSAGVQAKWQPKAENWPDAVHSDRPWVEPSRARDGRMKLVILDLDQTLVEVITIHDEAASKVFKEFFNVDARLTEIDYAGRSLTDSFAQLAKLKNIPEDKVKLAGLLKAYEQAFAETIPADASAYVLPGVRKLLEFLSRTDKLLALYTGDSRAVAASILKVTSLEKYFRIAVFGDDAPTRADMVRLVLDKAEGLTGRRFQGKGIVIIGDSLRDIECGKQFSALTIAVATGIYSEMQLAGAAPDYLFSDLKDCKQVLKAIGV